MAEGHEFGVLWHSHSFRITNPVSIDAQWKHVWNVMSFTAIELFRSPKAAALPPHSKFPGKARSYGAISLGSKGSLRW